jgi:hypothetical protein
VVVVDVVVVDVVVVVVVVAAVVATGGSVVIATVVVVASVSPLHAAAIRVMPTMRTAILVDLTAGVYTWSRIALPLL